MRILFLGTPAFAVPILEALHENFEVVGVVTQPDKPAGRKLALTTPPVKTKALELGLPVFQPEKASEIPGLTEDQHIDFLITAAYGQILPREALDIPYEDALNVHASLLPKYRGATPLQRALLNGDKETGISIMRMEERLDSGPIFSKRKIDIDPEMRYPDLEKLASSIGATLLLEVLNQYERIHPISQDEQEASYCGKISKEDGLVDPQKETARQIFDKLRAYSPWPGVYTRFQGEKLSLLDFSPQRRARDEKSFPPGTVFEDEGRVLISCSTGAIALQQVQLEGKKPSVAKDFVNGHRQFIGSLLPS